MVFIVHAANFTLLHIAASHITSQPHSTGCVPQGVANQQHQQHHVLHNKLSKILQYLLAINILGIHIASFIKNYHYQISHHKASLHVVISLRSKTDAILSTQHNQLYAIILCIQHTSGHTVPSHLRIQSSHSDSLSYKIDNSNHLYLPDELYFFLSKEEHFFSSVYIFCLHECNKLRRFIQRGSLLQEYYQDINARGTFS